MWVFPEMPCHSKSDTLLFWLLIENEEGGKPNRENSNWSGSPAEQMLSKLFHHSRILEIKEDRVSCVRFLIVAILNKKIKRAGKMLSYRTKQLFSWLLVASWCCCWGRIIVYQTNAPARRIHHLSYSPNLL